MADIKDFTANLSFEQFQSDKKSYLAVIRCLEIIGEAANHTPDEVQARDSDIPWRKIRDFRVVFTQETD